MVLYGKLIGGWIVYYLVLMYYGKWCVKFKLIIVYEI